MGSITSSCQITFSQLQLRSGQGGVEGVAVDHEGEGEEEDEEDRLLPLE